MTDLKEAFWHRMNTVRAGLLEADGERPVPMAPQADPSENAIWFVAPAGSAADRASKSGGEARFSIADPKANLYATVDGRVDEHTDDRKLDEMWTAMASAWFPAGRDDQAVRLIKFTPHVGEVWATDGAAAYLIELAKAKITHDTPETGEPGRIVF